MAKYPDLSNARTIELLWQKWGKKAVPHLASVNEEDGKELFVMGVTCTLAALIALGKDGGEKLAMEGLQTIGLEAAKASLAYCHYALERKAEKEQQAKKETIQ